MNLKERLAEMAAASAAKMPAEAKALVQKHFQAIHDSGQLDRAIGVGDTAPSFELMGADGPVSLTGALANGPAVLTYFRGSW